MMIGKSRPRSMKMPGSRSHAGCRDGLWQTPELGAREPGDHRCEGLHRLARHHDVGEAPPLAALQKPLTQFVRGADQDDRKLERVLTRKAEHGCGAHGSAAAGDGSGGEGHNLEFDRTEPIRRRFSYPGQATVVVIERGLARRVNAFLAKLRLVLIPTVSASRAASVSSRLLPPPTMTRGGEAGRGSQRAPRTV